MDEQRGGDDGNERDRDAFDIQHEAGGDFDVVIRDEAGYDGREGDRRQRGDVRDAEAGERIQEDVCEGDEASNDRGGSGDVGEEERERRDGGEDGRERAAGVDVERTRRGGLAREGGDAQAHQDHEAHRDEVGDGRALAGENEDQRDR